VIGLPDLAIATSALEHDAAVLTFDDTSNPSRA
jgi:predicted nucleic acid-binding protein